MSERHIHEGNLYVVGFAFDTVDRGRVLLIRTNRPTWQAGRLNGVGGHIERTDEHPHAAMQREFLEEAGLDVANWREFAQLEGDDFRVHVFRVTLDSFEGVAAQTDEPLVVVPLPILGCQPVISNLLWLIPLAMDAGTPGAPDNGPQFAKVRY